MISRETRITSVVASISIIDLYVRVCTHYARVIQSDRAESLYNIVYPISAVRLVRTVNNDNIPMCSYNILFR